MQYLVITTDNGEIEWSAQTELLKAEAGHVRNLCKNGIVKNIWFSEKKDALLILECDNLEQAIAVLEEFPLVKSNLIKYEITSLFPYTGFERLTDGTDQHD